MKYRLIFKSMLLSEFVHLRSRIFYFFLCLTRSLVTSGDRENDEDRVGEEVTRSVLYG